MKVCTSAPSILKFFVPTCGIGTPGFLLHTVDLGSEETLSLQLVITILRA